MINYILGLGRRKRSIAKIYMKSGEGKITINDKKLEEYFDKGSLISAVKQPLELTNTLGNYDIVISVNGGGTTGQAEAIRLGISRALIKSEPNLKKQLKGEGYLTRDPRKVERKKYGQAKARKRYQFSKR
ncbi:30S ribosomal protein S9 [Candidatus Dependentiae bacterium]|nr:30S ribosomal protein S9 [Candidatus Dependentiae bacterium]